MAVKILVKPSSYNFQFTSFNEANSTVAIIFLRKFLLSNTLDLPEFVSTAFITMYEVSDRHAGHYAKFSSILLKL